MKLCYVSSTIIAVHLFFNILVRTRVAVRFWLSNSLSIVLTLNQPVGETVIGVGLVDGG